jgi:hypothetical protein
MNKDFQTRANFFGRVRELRIILENVKDPRRTSTVQIKAAPGMGRTALFEYIEELVEAGVSDERFRHFRVPDIFQIVTVYADAHSFPSKDGRLVEFLDDAAAKKFDDWQANPVENHADYVRDFAQRLSRYSVEGEKIIVFLIDNFSRAMLSLSEEEAKGLAVLRVSGVHFLFATEHRDFEEINPRVAFASDFFRQITRIHMFPLYPSEAQAMAEHLNETSFEAEQRLSAEDLELAYRLAGGHPALLRQCILRLQRDKFGALYDSSPHITPLEGDFLKKTLRHFPIRDEIEPYLNLLQKPIETLNPEAIQPRLQEFLLDVAANRLGMPEFRGKWLQLEGKADLNLLYTLGVLDGSNAPNYPPQIIGELVRFAILLNSYAISFTLEEKTAFELLLGKRGQVVSFEELKAALGLDPTDDNSIIHALMQRIRLKVNTAPNSAAFHIDGVRGTGFRMDTLACLDMLFDEAVGVNGFSWDNEVLKEYRTNLAS